MRADDSDNGVNITMRNVTDRSLAESEDSINTMMDLLIVSIERGEQAAEYDAIFVKNSIQLREEIDTIT